MINIKEYFMFVLLTIIGIIIFVSPSLLLLFIMMEITDSDLLQIAIPMVVTVFYLPFAGIIVDEIRIKMDL